MNPGLIVAEQPSTNQIVIEPAEVVNLSPALEVVNLQTDEVTTQLQSEGVQVVDVEVEHPIVDVLTPTVQLIQQITSATAFAVDRTDINLSPAYSYYGGTVPSTGWKINKWLGTIMVSATSSINPTYTDLDSAWDDRAILSYT